jgi:penicillin-binding protein 2
MMQLNEDRHTITRRVDLIRTVGYLAMGFLVLGFWYYQVLHGSYYRERSENNRLKTQVLYAPRGLILDRERHVLAGNTLSFDLELIREDMLIPQEQLLAAVSRVVELPLEQLEERVEKYKSLRKFRPILLKENLSLEEVSHFSSRRESYAGIRVDQKHLRHYDGDVLGAHLMGYVGEVTAEQVRRTAGQELELLPGDLVGKAGLEMRYNKELQGANGLKKMVVNSIGREIREHDREPPIQGCTVRLTIDKDLQFEAEKAFGEHTGAAIFLDPNSGRILALVSRPVFDPNKFAVRLSGEFWNSIITNPEHPLQNRAIQSKYPPGSAFKIIMATAGLEEGVITPASARTCVGHTRIYNHTFRCWRGGGHGTVALKEAIHKSCNVYFYHLGAQLGIDTIHKWAARFGLGSRTDIDLDPETPGTIPSVAWKKKTFDQPWYPGETISIAIGQGYLEVTPIQMAVAMAAVGNGGTRYRPYLVEEIEGREGYFKGQSFEPYILGDLRLKPSTIEVLKEALWMVVNVDGGTARRARVAGFDVCGKTSTAQIHKASVGVKPKDLPREMRDHAWFSGFAPRDNPEIAYCVFIEHGGHGGDTAAPVVQQVLEKYVEKYHPQPEEADPVVVARAEPAEDE